MSPAGALLRAGSAMTDERDPWYQEWFGEEYLALYPERDDREARRQAVFARELLAPYARLGRLRFLDLACGTGRHAVALHDGVAGVVGLDLSSRLLLQARRRQGPARPYWVRGDMRQLPFRAGAFGAVVKHFREGKPRGYAFTLAYKSGVLGILPEGLRPPGLLPARGYLGPRLQRFSGVAGPADDDGPEARHFWSGKRRGE